MKVKFLKDHVSHSLGDVVDIDTEAANYLIAVGAAEKHNQAKKEPKKELKPERQTKQLKTDTETK